MDLRINSCTFTAKPPVPIKFPKVVPWYESGIIPKRQLAKSEPADPDGIIENLTRIRKNYAKG